MNRGQTVALKAIRSELHNLEQTIGALYHITLSAPRDPAWEHVRQLVNCLDSAADVIRQTLDVVKAEE